MEEEEELRAEQEAKLAKEQKRMEQQWQVSKVLLDGLYDSSCNLSLLRGTPNIMKEIWQQLLHMVDNLDLNHHYQSSNVKKNIFLITISVHMFQQCSNDFSSNLK